MEQRTPQVVGCSAEPAPEASGCSTGSAPQSMTAGVRHLVAYRARASCRGERHAPQGGPSAYCKACTNSHVTNGCYIRDCSVEGGASQSCSAPVVIMHQWLSCAIPRPCCTAYAVNRLPRRLFEAGHSTAYMQYILCRVTHLLIQRLRHQSTSALSCSTARALVCMRASCCLWQTCCYAVVCWCHCQKS